MFADKEPAEFIVLDFMERREFSPPFESRRAVKTKDGSRFAVSGRLRAATGKCQADRKIISGGAVI